MASKSLERLPLAFGESQAARHVDARSLADDLAPSLPGLNAYAPLGNPSHFFAKSSTVKLPGLTVVSSVMSPTYVDRSGHQEMLLIIPLEGKCTVSLAGKTLVWGDGIGSVFMPEMDGRIDGEGDERNLVLFNLERDPLERTARAVMGLPPDKKLKLNLEEPRLLPLEVGGLKFEITLRQLGGLINYHQLDPQNLARLGFSEMFYRYIVGLLHPKSFAPPAHDKSASPRRFAALDRVCDEMQSNLGKPWSLTELELMSHLSARALQYAFKTRFGCSPLEWLREERLQYARKRLLLQDFQTITQLAHECGFGDASQFAAYYKARFGVTPRQTR